MVLDKNPKQVLDNNFSQIKKEFSYKSPNIILCSHPFLKTEFLNRLVNSNSFPIIFLDFDLLYSGFLSSGMIKKNEKLKIFQSSKTNFEKDVKDIVKKISKERTLIILDSLNGVYNMFDELDSARFINATIMLLSSIARQTKSIIVITAIALKNDHKEWVVSPSGRHLLNSKQSGLYYLSMSETHLILKALDRSQDKRLRFEIKK